MKKLLVTLCAILAIALGGLFLAGKHAATVSAANCNPNDIMPCGAANISEFRTKYHANSTGDLPMVYDTYNGMNASMIDGATTKEGVALKNGDIIVDGKVVATNASSIGRNPIHGNHPITLGGKTFYETPNQLAFASDSLPAIIFFDENGKFVAGALKDCGNAIKATPKPVPVFKCTGLTVTTVGREDFSFKASAQIVDATFKSVTYTVRNGGSVVGTPLQRTDLKPVAYHQAAPGNFTVDAVITVDASGQIATTPVGNCQKSFTVKAATYVCKALSAVQSGDRTNFLFTPQVMLEDATLKTVVYTVKDAQGNVVDTITSSNVNPVTYTQTKEGNYTVQAVVTVTVDGQEKVASGNCAAAFEVKPAPVTPNFTCTRLTSNPVAGQKNTFAFTLTYVAEGGAQLTKVGVDFGDGTGSHDIALSQLASFNYAYPRAGTFNAVATLTFTVNGETSTVKTSTCSAPVTVSEMCIVPGKESLPAGSDQCFKPCATNPNVAEGSSECKLVNTGPGDIVGMFAATTVAGAIAHRLVWVRRFGR